MGLFVRFWGTRGSIPTPGHRTRVYGGNTSCVTIRADDTLLVCDAGTGLRELGVDLKRAGGPVTGHIFFSHTHWDHIQGFPFFVPAYVPGNTFHVYGGHTGDGAIYDLLSGQMRSDYFPVNFADLGANIVPGDLDPAGMQIDDVKVEILEQIHPGGSQAFAFCWQGKRVVFATDNELDQELENADECALNPATPRQIPKRFVDFVQDADLLIADAQYTDEEYASKAGWGHSRATTAVDFAVQADVKQLALFHHDPMHSDNDIEALVVTCRQRAARQESDVVVFAAREGMELRIR